MMFKAALTGPSEVPPTGQPGSAAVTVDTDTKNSSGPPAMLSLRTSNGPAAAGANADPMVDISAAIAKGSADISDEQLADLHAGKWYINLHTEKFPDGEIRGQLEKAQ
jgi:hypothetical protein